MITLPLKMRHCGRPVHEAAAWFIAGDDPTVWLREIVRWGADMAEIRVYIVPRSVGDRRACGALVVAPASVAAQALPRGAAYGLVAGRLYVPVEARLSPAMSDDEIRSRVPGPAAAFHPTVGLVRFEAGDALTVADLLESPAARAEAWDGAHPGLAAPPRMTCVEPASPPTIEEVIEEGREDMGSRPLEGLPPSPTEPHGGTLGDAGRKAAHGVVSAIRWLTDQIPTSPNGSRTLGGLRDWSHRMTSDLLARITEARNRELVRLMHLLKVDPDEGLRYALPLEALGGRGVAPPSVRLPRRDPSFALGRIRGGRPADSWTVPPTMYQSLQALYREAANRAIGLGRHRRAAYIYAELLGDFRAAAGALRQGRHFREAAVLYRDHLKEPKAAAECLEEGGLLVEAVEMFRSLGELEHVGEIYARLGQPEAADEAWRGAVRQRTEAGDALAAARILETRLRAPDEALGVLEAGWPYLPQAAGCLRARFELLGRLARHEATADLIAALRRQSVTGNLPGILAGALRQAAASYPDSEVRRLAADATRVVVGRELVLHPGENASALLNAVAQLAPEDRLLVRDCTRYRERNRAAAGARPLFRQVADRKRPVLVRSFELISDVTWKRVLPLAGGFCAAGASSYGAVVVRGTWRGELQALTWIRPGLRREEDVLMACVRGPEGRLVIQGAEGTRLDLRRFPVADVFPEQILVETPAWVPEKLVGLTQGPGGMFWLVLPGRNQLYLRSVDAVGAPASEAVLCDASTGGYQGGVVHVVSRAAAVYATVGNCLLHFKQKEGHPLECGPPIRGLSVTSGTVGPRIAAVFEDGGEVFWGGVLWEHRARFGEGLRDPVACFTRAGLLIAASAEEGRVYRTDHRRVIHISTFGVPQSAPIAILPTAQADEFALFGSDGVVRILRAPPVAVATDA